MPTTYHFEIQVRFGDTDALGHVNNAAYASYTEAARLAFFQSLAPGLVRSLASAPARPSAGDGLGVILAHLSIDFRRQVAFGESVRVETTVAAIGRKSVTLRQVIYAGPEVAAETRAVMVAFDYESQESREVPAGLRARLEAYLAP
jgi:acyl-CoA thioester hydrolase